jgi:cysteine desulfurase
MKRIYLDYAATTPVHPDVVAAMNEFFTEKFGNPSSIHSRGLEAKAAVENVRKEIAVMLGAAPEEIIFTSGGSESDNFAVKGVAYALKEKGDHLITSTIEHHAVLETCQYLQEQGFRLTVLPVDAYGLVDPDAVKRVLTDKTILVSIMHANNEIGTIEPIEEIGRICRARGVYFHTDAVQTFGSLPINVDDLNVDLLSLSAHKFYGPKGVGLLYIRKGTRIVPLIHGGGQEWHKRASTLNVPGIVGMAKAAELAQREMSGRVAHYQRLRDRLIKGLLDRVPEIRLNGHPEKRLPNNCSLIVKYVEGEAMLLKLDELGIETSTGSACSSGTSEPSHVIVGIGTPPEECHGSLRLSVGRLTTEEDIDYVLAELPRVVAELRSMSPFYQACHRKNPA